MKFGFNQFLSGVITKQESPQISSNGSGSISRVTNVWLTVDAFVLRSNRSMDFKWKFSTSKYCDGGDLHFISHHVHSIICCSFLDSQWRTGPRGRRWCGSCDHSAAVLVGSWRREVRLACCPCPCVFPSETCLSVIRIIIIILLLLLYY